MGPKKLSGAQNRKRKAILDEEDKKYAGTLKRFLEKPSECSIQMPNNAPENNESSKSGCSLQECCSEYVEDSEIAKKSDECPTSCIPSQSTTTAEGTDYNDFSVQLSEDSSLLNPSPEKNGSTNFQDVVTSEDNCVPTTIESDPALWPKLTSANIDLILSAGPVQLNNINFKKDGRNRHFSEEFYIRALDNGEKQIRRWLVYSKTVNKVFCFCCKLFDNNPRTSLAMEGSQDWTHMSVILKSHETSASHFIAGKKWMEAQLRLTTKTTIDQHMQNSLIQERRHWRDVLERLLRIAQLLAERNLAFRGSSDRLFTPNNGNFLAIVELLGRYDVVLSEHLRRVVSKETSDHYCGKTIQNEILNLMAKQVLNKITKQCKNAKYYSLILDCTTDISHCEQMSFTLRFLEETSGNYLVKEHFLGFKNVYDTTGKGLTEVILAFLAEKDIDIDDCRGQGYDNGANMAGKKNGVQANVLQKNSRAVFVPCGCHSLNLIVADAAGSNQQSKDVFGIIQCIYNVFSSSAKRWKILSDHVSGFTVKPLCTTRWECRINCLKPLIHNMGEIQEALFALSEVPGTDPKTSHEALTLSQQIVEFKFIMSVTVWYDILYQINIVSKAMQKESSDLFIATDLINKTRTFLKTFRETGFESSFETAKKLAEDIGVEPVFKSKSRVRIKKSFFNYEGNDQPITDPTQEFKANFFYVVVDTAITSLEERFGQLEHHNKIWGFLYNIKNLPPRNELEECCLQLQRSLTCGSKSDINGAELSDELRHIQTVLSEEAKTPKQVLNFVAGNHLTHMFSNTWISLRILLTIPISVASGERSFSKLKLIKSYLRSTMSQERLSSLAVLSIENDILHSLDLNNAIDEFASIKARKVLF